MKIFTILFIVGLAIEGVAFLVNQMDSIPIAVRIISPQYARCLKGLRTLETMEVLESKDKGFDSFQKIFLDILREQNPSNNIDSINVLKFKREGARMTFSKQRTKEVIPIKVFISNGQELSWNLEDLTDKIEIFKNKNTLLISIVIFLLGAAIQILGFIITEIQNKA